MNEVVKMFAVLTVICLLSAFALTSLKNGLEARITQQEEFYIRGPAVKGVFEGAPNDPLADAFTVEVDGESWRIYPWIEDGECRAIALETAGKGGYGGDVRVIAGVNFTSGEITGVQVTGHAETPGVGTRAADPSYLRTYAGRTVAAGTVVALRTAGGEIVAVSGATRTSTAIADAVNKAVQFVLQNRNQIPVWVKDNRSGS